MSVQPGIGAGFQATLQDTGNPIALTSGSVFAWSTDDPTDVLVVGGGDTSTVQITISNPPASGRTSITVTASTVAPDGTTVSGELTTDILPGVEHVYTVSVSQMFAAFKK